MAYLFDMNQKQFAGLLLKDSECEKNKSIRGSKLAASIFYLQPTSQPENVSNERIIISTLYFHHTIYTKHIEPLAHLLHDKYHISIMDIQAIVHNSVTVIENIQENRKKRKVIHLVHRLIEILKSRSFYQVHIIFQI